MVCLSPFKSRTSSLFGLSAISAANSADYLQDDVVD
jgi:hypothetical protein